MIISLLCIHLVNVNHSKEHNKMNDKNENFYEYKVAIIIKIEKFLFD